MKSQKTWFFGNLKTLFSSKILLGLLALFLVPAVYAAVDVTYVFDQPNVNASAYNCLDASCTRVGPFSGQFTDGPYVTDGTITIRYPDTLNTHGYGVFFVSKGYRPLEIHATWHTNGVSGNAAPQTVPYSFTKMPNVCRAVVSELNFVNELQPYIPLVVNTSARLDANTASAFQLVDNEVGHVPSEFKQEYYGADTIVKMEVLKSGSVVYNQQKEFTAVKGNALIASSNVPVSFAYLPTETGNFLVRVTAQVVDDQCQANADTSAQGDFSVLQSVPQSQFYTIINKLTVNNTYPKIGEPVLVTFNKITNYADGVAGPYTPVQTDVNYIVKNGATTVYSRSTTLFANPDSMTPVTYSFTFVPTTAGLHNITVNGRANSALPATNPEITDSESMILPVAGPSSYTVTFNVRNSDNGSAISDANVTFGSLGTKTTNETGLVSFTSVPEGTYTYTIAALNFSSKSDTVKITSDKVVSVALHPGENESVSNTAPFMNLPDSLQIRAGTSRTFNYHQYVQDDQDADSSLRLVVTGGNSSITVDINPNGDVTLSAPAGFSGTEIISFRLSDTQNATATDSIVVSGSVSTSSPSFSSIPSVSVMEDGSAVRVWNLRDYVTDADTPDSGLVFSVVSVVPGTLATARIDDGQYLTVYTKQDANGVGTINVAVADGLNTDSAGIVLNVTPVNDAPVVIAVPKIPNINESTNYTLNLSRVFKDVDNDPLVYNVTPTLNVTFVINNSGHALTIAPDFNVNGTRTFNVTATDPSGLYAKATFQLLLNFVDDAPFLNAVIPDILTFEEVNNSIDLTPFENDPEEGPGANGNTLTWKMRLANETNVTPGTSLNTQLFTASINSNTDYLLVSPKVNQTGELNITLFLYDSTGKNVSQDILVNVTNVNDAPVFVNLTNKNGEAGTLFTYDVNATDSDPTSDVLSFSVLNSTPALSGLSIDSASGLINFTPATNGVFNITLQVCDNFNACTNGTFVLTLSDTTSPASSNQVTPPNPSVYAPNATYTFSIDWSDNGNLSNVTFEFNGASITNLSQTGSTYSANVTNLAAGNYTFRWTARDSANNLNSTNSSTFVVLKANSALDLQLNGTSGNITVSQGSTIPIFANLTNTTGSVSLSSNGQSIGSGNSPLTVNQTFTVQGLYNITASFAGNQNYTSASTTYVVTVPDTTPPSFGTQSVSPSSPAQFTNLYTFNVDVTDNVAVSSVTFELDGSANSTAARVGTSNTYQVNLTSLSVGNHTYRWFASDSSTNVNSTSSSTYTVTQGTPVIRLTLNGYAGNTSAQVNDTVTIVANVTNPTGGFVDLYINGSLVQNGTSPVTNTSVFNNTGSIPVMASFPGDANVTAGNVTYYLTITPIVSQTNITPASGSSFNYSSFTMTLDTTGVTTCAWSLSDVAQGSMTNSFTTSNGLQHTANISGLSLGSNNVHVACNNQSASANTDLTYTAQNILDGSTLVGTNTITNTDMRNSLINISSLSSDMGISNTLTNITASNSQINNSVLTNCVITNSIVRNTTASNCVYTNSTIGTNTTGSTIIGSSVSGSVTYSNVTNSNITNSFINNSAITNSVIVNSTFSNAVVSNANIANDVIYSGTISVGGFTYNAGTSGSANLSQIIPVPPVASFTRSGTLGVGSTLTFTSTSTDANIPGPMNDTMSYSWNFGDTATAGNLSSVTHSYSAGGTYTVTLTVTDAYNMSSISSQTFTITAGGGGVNNNRRSGGGGGSGGSPRIALTDTPVTRQVFTGQPLMFSKDGRGYAMALLMRRATTDDSSTEWVLNGVFYTVKKGEHKTFDLSKDGIADLDLEIADVGRSAATVRFKLAGATPVVTNVTTPAIPMFNFPPAKTVVPQPPETPEVPQVEEPEVKTDEKTVPVQAEVKDGVFTKMSKALKGLFSVDAKSGAVKAGIVIGIVLIGVIAYFIFVRWESF